MLDLRKTYIKKRELVEFQQFKFRQIRDILLELEQANALMNDPKVLLTKEETAEKLRCDPAKIPTKIPKVRIGRNACYQLGDIEDFIRTHKK